MYSIAGAFCLLAISGSLEGATMDSKNNTPQSGLIQGGQDSTTTSTAVLQNQPVMTQTPEQTIAPPPANGPDSLVQKRHVEDTDGVVREIAEDNNSFVAAHQGSIANDFGFEGQQPRAVIIGCCDSRFQTFEIDNHPVNDLFIIRNIGNQFKNAKGSVKYGVAKLGAKVVIVVGHADCGAVKAATKAETQTYKGLEDDIKTELVGIRVKTYSDLLDTTKNDAIVKENIEANIHDQVRAILDDPEVMVHESNEKHEKPHVFGAVFDLKNTYNKGFGALVFINYNGETDPKQIASKTLDLKLNDIIIKPETIAAGISSANGSLDS